MDYFLDISKQSLLLVLIMTAPPVLLALLVGLTISIVQATTQIQEQTLTFVPKLVIVVLSIVLLGDILSGQLKIFTVWLFTGFSGHVQ